MTVEPSSDIHAAVANENIFGRSVAVLKQPLVPPVAKQYCTGLLLNLLRHNTHYRPLFIASGAVPLTVSVYVESSATDVTKASILRCLACLAEDDEHVKALQTVHVTEFLTAILLDNSKATQEQRAITLKTLFMMSTRTEGRKLMTDAKACHS